MKKLALLIVIGFSACALIGCLIVIIADQVQLNNLKGNYEVEEYGYPVLEVITDQITI